MKLWLKKILCCTGKESCCLDFAAWMLFYYDCCFYHNLLFNLFVMCCTLNFFLGRARTIEQSLPLCPIHLRKAMRKGIGNMRKTRCGGCRLEQLWSLADLGTSPWCALGSRCEPSPGRSHLISAGTEAVSRQHCWYCETRCCWGFYLLRDTCCVSPWMLSLLNKPIAWAPAGRAHSCCSPAGSFTPTRFSGWCPSLGCFFQAQESGFPFYC